MNVSTVGFKAFYERRSRPRPRGEWRRLLAYALLLALGLALAALVLAWWGWRDVVRTFNRTRAYRPTPPVPTAPTYVLPLLAEEPAWNLARAALAAGDEAAFLVLMAHDLETPPAQRLILLRRYLDATPEPSPAGYLIARRLYHTAILHPYLNDGERLAALLYLLPRWHAWGEKAAFDATARSILAILRTSRALRPGQRTEALNTLHRLGIDLPAIDLNRLPPGPPGLPPRLRVPPPAVALPPDVQQAYRGRVEAARALLARPDDPRRRQRLAAALRAEHLARETFYRNAEAATPTPDAHVRLAWDRVRWRHLVWLVARGELGFSLVSEWHAQAGQHEFALIKAWERLVAQEADWMAAQPDVLWADQGTYELWAWTAWAGEWGLYPRYPRPYVWQRLRQAQERFFAHPNTPWRAWIALEERTDPPWFVLTLPPE